MKEGKYIYEDNNGYGGNEKKGRKLLQKLILPSGSGESFIAQKRTRVCVSRPADVVGAAAVVIMGRRLASSPDRDPEGGGLK
jgi:hypothetical protein